MAPYHLFHLPSKSFIIAHISFINAHIVTSYNEISLKIYLILNVIFMLPNVNLAIMDSIRSFSCFYKLSAWQTFSVMPSLFAAFYCISIMYN